MIVEDTRKSILSFSVNVVAVNKYIDKDGNDERIKNPAEASSDSIRFIGSSLDSLSRNLTDNQCKNLGKFYRGEEFQLLLHP